MLNHLKVTIASIGARMQARYDCDRLMRADERILRDIGISRADVSRLCRDRRI